MHDDSLTKKQLLDEISLLRSRLADLEQDSPPQAPFPEAITLDLPADATDMALMVVQEEVIVFVNDTVLRFLACRREDIIGRPIADLIQPEEKDTVVDRHHRRISGQEPPPTYSLRAMGAKGRSLLVELRAIRILYRGKPAVLCLFSDRAQTDLSSEVLEVQRNLGRVLAGRDPKTDPLAACLKLAVRVSSCLGGAILKKNRAGLLTPLLNEALDPDVSQGLAAQLNRAELGKAFSAGRPVYPGKDDFGGPAIIRELPDQEPVFLKILVPILKQGRTLACLALVSKAPERISENIREAFEALVPLFESIILRGLSEEAGQESRERLQTLVEAMPDGLAVFNPEGEFTFVNNVLQEMLGYSTQELLGRPLADLLTSGEEAFTDLLESGQEGRAAQVREATWLTKEGREIYTINRTQPLFARDGSMSGGFSVTTDISATKKALEDLAVSESRFRGAFDNAAVGMALVDPQGKFLELNGALRKMLGYEAGELVGTSQEELIMDDQPDPPGIKLRRKDGAPVWVIRARSQVRDIDHNPLYHICQFIDISEHRRASLALARSDERFRRIYEGLPTPCLTWEKSGLGFKVTDFNLAMALLDRSVSESVGPDSLEEFFRNRPEIMADLESCLDSGSFLQREAALEMEDPEGPRHLHLSYATLPPDKVIMICRDETSRYQAEALLRKSEEHLRSLMESAQDFVVYRLRIDPEPPHRRSVVFTSPSIKEIVGLKDPRDLDSWYTNVIPEDLDRLQIAMARGLADQGFSETLRINHPEKGIRWLKIIAKIIPDETGRPAYSNGLISDVTDLMLAEEALKEKEEELEIQAASLSESNIALRVLLQNLQQDKETFQENIISNFKRLVVPGLDALLRSGLNQKQEELAVSILESLSDITNPFVKRLSAEALGLTRRELEVAKLVREGLPTSTIAESLGISNNAVALHRKNIRAKLGLKSRKENLSVYLKNLSL